MTKSEQKAVKFTEQALMSALGLLDKADSARTEQLADHYKESGRLAIKQALDFLRTTKDQ